MSVSSGLKQGYYFVDGQDLYNKVAIYTDCAKVNSINSYLYTSTVSGYTTKVPMPIKWTPYSTLDSWTEKIDFSGKFIDSANKMSSHELQVIAEGSKPQFTDGNTGVASFSGEDAGSNNSNKKYKFIRLRYTDNKFYIDTYATTDSAHPTWDSTKSSPPKTFTDLSGSAISPSVVMIVLQAGGGGGGGNAKNAGNRGGAGGGGSGACGFCILDLKKGPWYVCIGKAGWGGWGEDNESTSAQDTWVSNNGDTPFADTATYIKCGGGQYGHTTTAPNKLGTGGQGGTVTHTAKNIASEKGMYNIVVGNGFSGQNAGYYETEQALGTLTFNATNVEEDQGGVNQFKTVARKTPGPDTYCTAGSGAGSYWADGPQTPYPGSSYSDQNSGVAGTLGAGGSGATRHSGSIAAIDGGNGGQGFVKIYWKSA